MLGNREEAQEATLSVYVQVWRSAATFDSARSDGAAWLFMLARSRALDRLRALRRRPACADILEHAEVLADEHQPPQSSADLRERSIDTAIRDLASRVDPERFRQAFGAGLDQLDALITQQTVTIAKLMEIAPPGTVNPTPSLYNLTMYLMAALLAIALVANALMKPVDAKHHMTDTNPAVAR